MYFYQQNFTVYVFLFSFDDLNISNVYPYDLFFRELSGNPFLCDCDVRNFLFEFRYDSAKAVLNEEQTMCTDVDGIQHVFMDFWNDTCSTFIFHTVF